MLEDADITMQYGPETTFVELWGVPHSTEEELKAYDLKIHVNGVNLMKNEGRLRTSVQISIAVMGLSPL